MPGISFVYDIEGNLKLIGTRILSSLESLVHSEQYQQEVLFHDDFCFLGCTRYEKYPFAAFENDRYRFFLEGKIYNKDNSAFNRELDELAEAIFRKEKNFCTLLADWLLDTDGDFLVTLLQKSSNDFAIFNDALGRLPLYCFRAEKRLIVSREIRFMARLVPDRKYDRYAIAQYLLFGYPLGKRTLFRDAQSLQPGTLIYSDSEKKKIRLETVHRFSFDQKKYKNINPGEITDHLYDLYLEACKNRADPSGKNVVALSGGLDSRAVSAALSGLNIPFSAATFLDYSRTAEPDVRIAREVANILHTDWKLFPLGPPRGADLLELLRIKNGLNPLRMSFGIPFFRKVKETFGSEIIYFTGDGGDKVLPDLRPRVKISDPDKLAKYVADKNQVIPLEKVAAFTGLEQQQIMAELKSHLMSYPEQSLKNKYVHFLVFERGFKWLYEGEDRNRFYFWSVTPFYSAPFFNCAINCPDRLKLRYRIYRQLLIKLSAGAAAIDAANWKLPISSPKVELLLFARDHIYFRLPLGWQRIVRNRFRKTEALDAPVKKSLECLQEQLRNCRVVSEYLSIGDPTETGNLGWDGFDNLFTIACLIEETECGKSSLEKYREEEFA